MKIDSPNPNAPQLTGTPAAQDRVELTKAGQAQKTDQASGTDGGGPKAKAAAAGAAPDLAQLSNLSHQLRTQTDETPERQVYLERLQKQVAAGEYNPQPGDIARSIVDDLLKP